MDKRTLSDMARCNRTAMICHLVEASMIAITFIAQLLVGSRGLLYSLLVVVLAMGPPLMELFFWSRDKESPAIKHLVAQGFAVMYTVILFTTTNNMLFLYVFPDRISVLIEYGISFLICLLDVETFCITFNHFLKGVHNRTFTARITGITVINRIILIIKENNWLLKSSHGHFLPLCIRIGKCSVIILWICDPVV